MYRKNDKFVVSDIIYFKFLYLVSYNYLAALLDFVDALTEFLV